MKKMWILRIFESKYCLFTFLLSLILVTLLLPKKIFYGYYSIIAILFIFSTSILITCLTRNIKEKVSAARASGASMFGVISVVVGFGALHSCVVGVPICGATIGAGIIGLLFPNFVLGFFENYALFLVGVSIAIQILALYFLKCFDKF